RQTKAIYYLLMIFVLIAVFQVLGLSIITQPLNSLLNVTFAYLPQLLGAAILLLIAWAIATLLKQAVLTFFSKTNIDEKIEEQVEGGREKVKLGATIAELLYWLVFILFLPAILSALSLNGLLLPIQNMVNIVLGFIPNLFAAAVVLLIGWFVAKLCKNIFTNFLKALKVDNFGQKSGLTVEDGNKSLSEILGMVIYIIILIPVIISALNILGLEGIAKPATDMLSEIFIFAPVLVSAFFIVAFAYFIGKMIGELTTSLLSKIGFDRVLSLIGFSESKINLSQLAGKLVVILIVLVASLEAANILGFSKLSDLVEQFIILAGNVLVGVIIVGAGLYIANLVADLIKKSGTKNAGILAMVARTGILVLTIAMGLSQMGLASNIITWAFIFLAGSLAVSFAIAFGFGGRDLAAKKLAELDDKMKHNI
ncbi:MAG TPA: mechanosensitive ion channel, partial [Desulfitobacteriaceae bacterium]|nr:mechanosensitive ion channel [Desulfitobacteriaceae bacterium]